MKDDRGFTLVELIVTIVVLIMIIGVTIPIVISARGDSVKALDQATQDLVTAAAATAEGGGLVHDEMYHSQYRVETLVETGYLRLPDDKYELHKDDWVLKNKETGHYQYYGPREANPDSDFTYTTDTMKETGEEFVRITGYTGDSKTVVIPDEIDGKRVAAVMRGSFDEKGLTDVYMGQGVERIDEYTFQKNKIKVLYLNDDIVTIEERAFWYNELEAVRLPSKLRNFGKTFTGVAHDGDVFAYNPLKTVDMSRSEDLKILYGFSFRDTPLEHVVLPPNLEYLGGHSFRDLDIKEVVIPDSVTYIGHYAFSNNQLQSISLPENLTFLGQNAFDGNLLSSVKIPEGITEIRYGTFLGNRLTEVELPGSLEIIGPGAFQNNQLNEVIIPNNVKTIGRYAFGFNELGYVELPASGVTLDDASFARNHLGWVKHLSKAKKNGNPFSSQSVTSRLFEKFD